MTKVFSTNYLNSQQGSIEIRGKQIGYPLRKYYHLYDTECQPFDFILFSASKVHHGWIDHSLLGDGPVVHWYEVSREDFEKQAVTAAKLLEIPLSGQNIATEVYPPAVMKRALSSLAWTKVSIYNISEDKLQWFQGWTMPQEVVAAPSPDIPPLLDDMFDAPDINWDVLKKANSAQVKPTSPYAWTIKAGKLERSA